MAVQACTSFESLLTGDFDTHDCVAQVQQVQQMAQQTPRQLQIKQRTPPRQNLRAKQIEATKRLNAHFCLSSRRGKEHIIPSLYIKNTT